MKLRPETALQTYPIYYYYSTARHGAKFFDPSMLPALTTNLAKLWIESCKHRGKYTDE